MSYLTHNYAKLSVWLLYSFRSYNITQEVILGQNKLQCGLEFMLCKSNYKKHTLKY